MNLIPCEPAAPPPVADQVAEVMLRNVNEELPRRIAVHREGYRLFWDSPCTPDAVLASLGSNAQVVLACAGENVDHIGRLAAIVGKPLNDFLPAEFWQPKRAFVAGPDGTMTLADPADGCDAWGRALMTP